jgi:hypothetical protein
LIFCTTGEFFLLTVETLMKEEASLRARKPPEKA